MDQHWKLIVIILGFGGPAFSAEIDFKQLIVENTEAQIQLAQEIQTHLGLTKEKTLEAQSVQKTVLFKGQNQQIF